MKLQVILPPPLFPTARRLLWKTPPRRGDFCIRLSVVGLFALDSGPLKSNGLSIYSLNYQNLISKVAFTLQWLLFAYHSTPSVIFVTKRILGGGTFYCSIALYQNPHEIADIEAIAHPDLSG